MQSRLIWTIIAVQAAANAAFADEERLVSLSGKVVDEMQHPVAHAQVIVRDRTAKTSQTTHTNREGLYEALHAPAQRCDVIVIPPHKSGLAQAFLQDVPSEDGRHLVVSVKKGFEIGGKVIADGKPLKGATVKVVAADGDTVHGGAQATTDSRGCYSIVLTPGEKLFEVETKSSDPAGIQREKFSVTRDATMPEITVQKNLAKAAK